MIRPKRILIELLILLGFWGTGMCLWIDKGNDSTNVLIINEVCSHNSTIMYNDVGFYTDYVELYNNTQEVIDLSQFYLSDKIEVLNLYNLEETVLYPGEYTVVFVDRENAGFSIGDEETIFLSDFAGNIVDTVTVPILALDMVYARNINSLQWEVQQIATPGSVNSLNNNDNMTTVHNDAIPMLSVKPGFYSEPFFLNIDLDDEYEIYYTLDGSVPTKNAIRYDGPIWITDVSDSPNVYSAIKDISIDEKYASVPAYSVDKCNIVRAIGIAENGDVTKEAYGTYFVDYEERYGYGKTYVLSLITDPDNLFSKEKGIYVNGKLADQHWYGVEEPGDVDEAITNYSREGKGWKKPAYAQLFDCEGMLYEQPIRIGIHGNHTVKYSQKGFNLLGIEDEDSKYVFQGLLGEENTSLMLRAGGAFDWKRTQFRDNLNQKLVEDRDLTTLQAVPCQVFLDGEYWGCYNLQERIDKGLIAGKFGVREEDVIVIKNNNVVGANDSYYELYSSVVEFAKEHDLSKEAAYKKIEEMIDIQSYIDYYCFQIYVAACDTVGNNYSCWRTKNILPQEYYDGKWRWIVYDTDDSTGVRDDYSKVDVDSFSEGHLSITPMEDILFSALIENETFKKQFVLTFVEMADNNFESNHVEELIDELCDEYMEASVVSHIRFGREESEENYRDSVNVVKDFFYNRREYIMEYLKYNLDIEDLGIYLELVN